MTTLSLTSAHRVPTIGTIEQRPAPLRLTARGRRVFTALVVAPLLALLMTLSFIFAGQAEASQQGGVANFEYLTVNHGDTLWSLAAEIAPDADPREVIADFKRLNALSSSSVIPGQQLAIPAQYVFAQGSDSGR